jgi:zinc transporter ZupT
MPLSHWIQATDPVLGEEPPSARIWIAVLLVALATVAGAWLARRRPGQVVAWLAIASATMLVVTLTDLLPDAWRDAVETGVPLWVVGVAVAAGFLAIALFTREDHGLEIASDEEIIARHAPGRHRLLKETVGAALFGGVGTATALTTHRAIEGATLALSTSAVVVVALIVHSASEGLALAALLDMADQRMGPWLVVACLSPVAGVVFATVNPLPGRVVPVLLGMVAGILLRTAVVGLRLAVRKREGGRLVTRHLAVAAVVAVTVGALLAMAHEVQRRIGRDQNTRYIETFGHARPPRRAIRPGELGPQGHGESSARTRPSQSRNRSGRSPASRPPPPRPTAPRPQVGRAPIRRPPVIRTPTGSPSMARPTTVRPTTAGPRTAGPTTAGRTARPPAARAPGPRAPAQSTPVPRSPGGRDRAAILAAVKSGRTSLADVLGRRDTAARRLRVARLLRALPGYDASSAAALMARAGVDEKRRVGGLSERQRRRLLRALAACRCPR